MIDCLVTDADLARLLREREARERERSRVICKRRRCRKRIPAEKRADAVYCSEACRNRARADERDDLVREIVHTARAAKLAVGCACGAALTAGRHGPVPQKCPRCYSRDSARQCRAKRRPLP